MAKIRKRANDTMQDERRYSPAIEKEIRGHKREKPKRIESIPFVGTASRATREPHGLHIRFALTRDASYATGYHTVDTQFVVLFRQRK